MAAKHTSFEIGIHPINWVGEDVLEHGSHTSAEQVLQDMSELGFRGTEVSRKFPTNVKDLKNLLNAYKMVLTTQWKSVNFSGGELNEQLNQYREHCQFLSEFGCKVVSTAEIGGSILNQDPSRNQDEINVIKLTDEKWKRLINGLNEAGHIAKTFNMDLVYHAHAGTVVENQDELNYLLSQTDADVVSFLYDTGHCYYGGMNPLEVLQKHFNRIKYVHLKDVRSDIIHQVKGRSGIRESIRKGMFTVPGDGDIDFKPILKECIQRNYSGWMLIEGEQDPTVHNPFEYAKKSKLYLEKIINSLVKSRVQ